jgi:hypothetical protein
MAESIADREERERQEALAKIEEHDTETESRLKSDEFVVVAPLVTLKVKDQLGAYVLRGFNEGAVVKAEDVEAANLRHHVDIRFLAPTGSPDTEFAGPAGTPKPGEPPNVPVEVGTPVEMLPTEERLRRNREAADANATEAKRTTSRSSSRTSGKD